MKKLKKTAGMELMYFALNKKGQFVYNCGDLYAFVFSEEAPIEPGFSLCQVGAGFVFVPIYVIEEQIKELQEGKYTKGAKGVSYSVFVPHPGDTSSLPGPYSKILSFFKYEKESIVLTSIGDRDKWYSKEEAEKILGQVTLVEVDVFGKRKKYYVSEASRLTAEAFKKHEWCVRILGLPAKKEE